MASAGDTLASLDALLGALGDPLGVSDAPVDVPTVSASSAVVSSAEDGDPADALASIYQVDCSPLLDQDDRRVDVFQDLRAKMDVAMDATLLIGVETALYTAQLSAGSRDSAHGSDAGKPTAELTLLAGSEELALEEDELITDVKWVDNERFAVSFSSGVLRIFHREGRLQYAQKFHHAGIVKLDISPSVSTKVTANTVREVDVHASEAQSNGSTLSSSSSNGGELWVLYDDATVAIVQVQELLLRIRAAVYGPAQANKFRKYALRDQSDITAVAPCGPSRPTIFQSHPRLGVHTVVSVGTGPFLSFYQAGNDHNSIIHLAHIATAIASRAAGAVWTFAKSWGWSSGSAPNSDEAPTGDANASGEMRAVDAAAEHVAAPVGSMRAITEDPRRRARTLVLSPTGRLAAISDTLGRILLVDTSRMSIIRMWKGYRYAQVGWMHGTEGKRRSRGLYLVIYSAQRGIVEVWRTRYGPRVFSFAVGNTARLFTHVDSQQQRTRCVVLSGSENGLLELIEVKSQAPSVSILVKYFTQNKLQEENFVLHQIIGAIQAYVKKKRADASHTLEQDSIDPVLSDIANLASTTSVQALLDVLLNPEMTSLSASFVLKVFEQLQPAIRNGMASRSPTGTELSLLWQLQWRHRILSAYVGLQTEYLRARHVLQSAIKDTSAVLVKYVAPDNETGNSRSRLVPWLELYRRAGHNWSEDNNESSRQSSVRAAELTWWEFMEYFSMPFTDAELPRRRDIVALYEQTERTEDFLREALQLLNVPVFRSSIRQPQLTTLMAFLFTPVLSNVFAVQELQQLHASIFVTPESHTLLFIEWYFSLPIGSILAIPPPSLSCAFQRWLTPYIGKPDFEGDMEENDRDEDEGADPTNKRRLSSCPNTLGQIFRACVRSQRLVHAFILSEQCRWGEQQQSKAVEESTLGKHSSVDGGLRWSILQDCLAKAVHLALRLGRLGKTSVEGVETVDEVVRLVALMQLNEGYDLEDDNLQAKLTQPSNEGGAVTSVITAYDPWVASLEHCRTSAQMKSWVSVLRCFPQFADKDTLFCFRSSLLCAAWNAERSDMHQLEDAINEVKALSSNRLKVAMGNHIWERYIRVHVVTLISFWEESAAGRKPQRGLQPQIARRFFSIIHGLLSVLIVALRDLENSDPVYLNGEPRDEQAQQMDEDDSEGSELGDGDQEDEGPAAIVMEDLTSRKRWGSPVRELRRVFDRKWPPSHMSSALMESLFSFPVDRVSSSRLGDHLSLILLLDSFAATSVTPVSITKLFPEKGRDLCRADSFMVDSNRPSRSLSAADNRALDKERTQFLRELLHYENDLGFALAESFNLPTELIREEYVVFLYQNGKDEQADFAFEKMKQPERLVPQLGSIARARLSLILQRMKAEVEYAMIMSILPADLFMWIVAEKLPPFVADKQVEKLDKAPSLTGTSMILLRCLSLMPPNGPEFAKISAMSVLVKDIIARVKHQQTQTVNGGST